MHDVELDELNINGGGNENQETLTLDQQRMAALADVDNAGFSLFHVKVALVAGVGFFTDAYDIFAISIASTMLAYTYTSCHSSMLPSHLDLGVKVATPVGTLCGQLVFGWLADILGRKRMYGAELMIIIVGCFAQALAGQADSVNIFGVIIVWRFFMGIGIGGDYPLSAVISSEFSSRNIRGKLMTMVFAAQGWGNFIASIVALIIVSIFKNRLKGASNTAELYAHVDHMWRLLIGLGCIPACLALYFRLTIPETPRFTMDIERNLRQATADVHRFLAGNEFIVDPDAVVRRIPVPQATRSDFLNYFSRWDNLKVLLGTCLAWFALDITFYGLGLNTSSIIIDIGFVGADTSNNVNGNFSLKTIPIQTNIGTINISPGGLNMNMNVTFSKAGASILNELDSISVANLDFSFENVSLNSTVPANISTVALGSCATGPIAVVSEAVYNNLHDVSVGNIILAAGGLIPGYYATFFFIDSWGRKPIQYMGFSFLFVLLLIMGFAFPEHINKKGQKDAFIFLYCLVNFFQNFGPNTTTFIVPGEAFPTRYRSTAHGISAASGKLGAIISQVIIALTGAHFKRVLQIFSFVMPVGLVATTLIPETRRRTLEDLSNESQDGFVGEPEAQT